MSGGQPTDAELKFWAEMAARQAMLHALRPNGGDDFRSVAREAIPRLIAEVERLRAERQRVADTLGPAVAFVRDWQICELRHMSDAPSARAACAMERVFRLLGVYPPEVTS